MWPPLTILPHKNPTQGHGQRIVVKHNVAESAGIKHNVAESAGYHACRPLSVILGPAKPSLTVWTRIWRPAQEDLRESCSYPDP